MLGGGAAPTGQAAQANNGLDLGDLLNAGMAFMNAKQQGQSNLQAALSAIMGAGPMAQKPYEVPSGAAAAGTGPPPATRKTTRATSAITSKLTADRQRIARLFAFRADNASRSSATGGARCSAGSAL